MDGPCVILVSRDGAHVMVTSARNHSLIVFARDKQNGKLVLLQRLTNGINGVRGLLQASSVTLSHDDAHVYTTAKGSNALTVFTREKSTGKLEFLECHQNKEQGVEGLMGAFHSTLTLDGRHLYVVSSTGHSIAVFRREIPTGKLFFVEHYKDGINGVDGLENASSVTVSP